MRSQETVRAGRVTGEEASKKGRGRPQMTLHVMTRNLICIWGRTGRRLCGGMRGSELWCAKCILKGVESRGWQTIACRLKPLCHLFVSKVLLAHSHTHPLGIAYGCLWPMTAELSTVPERLHVPRSPKHWLPSPSQMSATPWYKGQSGKKVRDRLTG